MKLPDKVYDALKWIALVALNAIGAFYYKLAEIWSLPYGDQISRTCQILALLIGTLIGLSTIQYNKEKKENE